MYCGWARSVTSDSDSDMVGAREGVARLRALFKMGRRRAIRDAVVLPGGQNNDTRFGAHPRWVVSISLNSAEEEAHDCVGHAFIIVGQPDGSYLWLQSFVGKYSLPAWLAHLEESTGSADLTYAALQRRLDLLELLEDADFWTEEVNEAYLELFNVNMDEEHSFEGWYSDLISLTITWQIACTFPLP
jgi:hypothetical protein